MPSESCRASARIARVKLYNFREADSKASSNLSTLLVRLNHIIQSVGVKMAPKHRDGDVVASVSLKRSHPCLASHTDKYQIPGEWVSYAHTVVAYCAFLGALVVGVYDTV